jgi:PAS domain S-box-containing protein
MLIEESQRTLTRIATLSITAVTALAAIAIVGWASNYFIAAQISPYLHIQMALSAALMILLLCASWFTYHSKPSNHGLRMLAQGCAFGVLVFSILVLIEFLTGTPLDIEQLFLRTVSGFSLAPTGRMSPIAAAALVLTSASLVMLTHSAASRNRRNQLAAILALGAASIGFVLGAALIYGSSSMPDVLSTAIALDVLGIGICASAGPTCWPVRIVFGQSVKAQLLRAFLPPTVVIFLFIGWLGRVDVGSPALTASFTLFLTLVAVIALASRTGQTVGERIDKAGDALRESEGRFRRITENMLDMIAQTDLQGICEYASPSFKIVLGYDPKYVLGRSLFELVHPNDLDNALEIVLKAPATGSAATFDYRCKHADGHYVWLQSVCNPISDETGQITGTILATRDITERKRTESALQEQARQLNCLYGIARSVEQYGSNLDAIMGEVVSIIPLGYAYSDVARTRIVLGTQVFESAGFKESIWSQSANIKVLGNIAGRVEVYYLEEKPRSFEGPFLKEERALIDTIAERLGRVVERKRVQDALGESEAKYRDLIENSTDLIQSVNNAGRFEYVNGKWMETLGYTQEETKQLTLMDVLRKDQVPHCNELFERVRHGETLDRVETVFVSKDGREILVAGNINGQFKNGQFVATRAIFRDITKMKKAENALRESEERYRAIFDGASDGFLAADMKTNKLVFANPKMCEMTGYSLKELLELSVPDMHPKKEVSFVIEQITKQLQGELHVAKEIPVLRKDKTVLYCDIRGKVIEIEGQRCMVGIFRDVTERRQVEGMKDQFVSMVSHELRTPLTSIRASLGLLASGVIGALPEKGQRMLDIAVTNTDRLVRLINDILDSERLASGKTPMQKKQCSTAQLVKQASDVMKPMAEKAGVSLSVESQDAELWADPDRIVQALTNLISNAIKFSSKGSKICVAAERKENQMLFKVQDEGQGIPPDKLGLLFERFQQLDSSDAREKGGSGLGLSISRSIIEQHNGKIWVESTVGKGSIFLFTLPLTPETQILAQPEATTEAQSAGKVLIIEDDPDLVNILKAMLQRHDIQLYIALTGEKGITLSKQLRPDMIVLDLGLPDMDGSAVVHALREDNTLRLIPLVVYTVRELDKQQQENLRLGETLFFTKSRIPPDQFEEKIVQFVKRTLEHRGKTNAS